MKHKFTSDADVITHGLESSLQFLDTRVLHHPIPTRLDPTATTQIPQTLKTDDDRHSNIIIAYIGGESLNLINLLMTHSPCEVNPL